MTYDPGNWREPVTESGLTQDQLWMTVNALGEMSRSSLDGILRGTREATRTEHNLIAQALNERLHDLGKGWPVPYRD